MKNILEYPSARGYQLTWHCMPAKLTNSLTKFAFLLYFSAHKGTCCQRRAKAYDEPPAPRSDANTALGEGDT